MSLDPTINVKLEPMEVIPVAETSSNGEEHSIAEHTEPTEEPEMFMQAVEEKTPDVTSVTRELDSVGIKPDIPDIQISIDTKKADLEYNLTNSMELMGSVVDLINVKKEPIISGKRKRDDYGDSPKCKISKGIFEEDSVGDDADWETADEDEEKNEKVFKVPKNDPKFWQHERELLLSEIDCLTTKVDQLIEQQILLLDFNVVHYGTKFQSFCNAREKLLQYGKANEKDISSMGSEPLLNLMGQVCSEQEIRSLEVQQNRPVEVCEKEISTPTDINIKASQIIQLLRNTVGVTRSKAKLKCHICAQEMTAARFWNHMITHTDFTYMCPSCKKTSKNKKKIRLCLREHHFPDPKDFVGSIVLSYYHKDGDVMTCVPKAEVNFVIDQMLQDCEKTYSKKISEISNTEMLSTSDPITSSLVQGPGYSQFRPTPPKAVINPTTFSSTIRGPISNSWNGSGTQQTQNLFRPAGDRSMVTNPFLPRNPNFPPRPMNQNNSTRFPPRFPTFNNSFQVPSFSSISQVNNGFQSGGFGHSTQLWAPQMPPPQPSVNNFGIGSRNRFPKNSGDNYRDNENGVYKSTANNNCGPSSSNNWRDNNANKSRGTINQDEFGLNRYQYKKPNGRLN